MADETVTITLTDEIAAKLEGLDLTPDVNRKLKVRMLVRHKEQLQADIATVNAELDELRKEPVRGDEVPQQR